MNLQKMVDDICVLTHFKGKERYMSNNEKMVREAAFCRISEHGQHLADIEVAKIEHDRLSLSIAALEAMYPEVKR